MTNKTDRERAEELAEELANLLWEGVRYKKMVELIKEFEAEAYQRGLEDAAGACDFMGEQLKKAGITDNAKNDFHGGIVKAIAANVYFTAGNAIRAMIEKPVKEGV